VVSVTQVHDVAVDEDQDLRGPRRGKLVRSRGLKLQSQRPIKGRGWRDCRRGDRGRGPRAARGKGVVKGRVRSRRKYLNRNIAP